MKKITSLFLAVLIITLSVFSLNAFALPATETDAPPATETDPVPETELLSVKWLKEQGKEFTADIIASLYGITLEKGKLYVKGDTIATLTTHSMNKRYVGKKTIANREGKFSFYPDFPFFYFKESTLSTNAISKKDFIDAYETADGYYIENFAGNNGQTASLKFKGGELEALYITADYMGFDLTYEITITSYEVDDKDVSLPPLAIDITFLYRFLVILGML